MQAQSEQSMMEVEQERAQVRDARRALSKLASAQSCLSPMFFIQ